MQLVTPHISAFKIPLIVLKFPTPREFPYTHFAESITGGERRQWRRMTLGFPLVSSSKRRSTPPGGRTNHPLDGNHCNITSLFIFSHSSHVTNYHVIIHTCNLCYQYRSLERSIDDYFVMHRICNTDIFSYFFDTRIWRKKYRFSG